MATLSTERSARPLANPVTNKMILAGTGLVLVGFLTVHLLGILSAYAGSGAMNSYVEKLHSLPLLVWLTRIALIVTFTLHIKYAVHVTLANRAARPIPYAQRNYQKSTVLSRSQIWTGLILAAFLLYHLLHFTFQTLGVSAQLLSTGGPDVYKMLLTGLKNPLSAIIYIAGLIALFFHLSHGIHSAPQTLGLTSRRTLPGLLKAATVVAALYFIAFVSIPATILAGILK